MTRPTKKPFTREALAVVASVMWGKRETTWSATNRRTELNGAVSEALITTLVQVQVTTAPDDQIGVYGLTAGGVQVGMKPEEALMIVRQGGVC